MAAATMSEDFQIHERLIAFLRESGAVFRSVEHPPTRTSEESAKARGESLAAGAKALVVRADDSFCLLVIPADRRLDSKLARRSLGVQALRFATPDELKATVGLEPGSIPPFGAPILNLRLFADHAVGRHTDNVAFNAASLTRSVVMPSSEWERVAQPTRVALTEEPKPAIS
jgi:prolyl-tRNA editing enzyme YbaK/EbsC (Cys-tRNA(Pro) deacylase)